MEEHEFLTEEAEVTFSNNLKMGSKFKTALAKKPTKGNNLMSDLSATMLALQVMSGVKFYVCEVCRRDNGPTQQLVFKANQEYLKDEVALAQMKHTFAAVRIIKEETTIDYDELADCNWLMFKIDDPVEIDKQMQKADLEAKHKLMQAKAINAAKQLLEASGLTLEDMKALLGPKS